MSLLRRLMSEFKTNWMTILVAWDGLAKCAPSLSVEEIDDFASERLSFGCNGAEEDLIVQLLALDLRKETRQTIRGFLQSLANLSGADASQEARKWRVVL